MTNFNANKFRPDPKPIRKEKVNKEPIKRTAIKPKEHVGFISVLDSEFSKYIRQSYADEYGRVKCYTCPTKKPWKQMQNGHFITRGNMAARYDEDNCRPQCKECNQFKNGKPVEFAKQLLIELGPKKFMALLKKKYEITQLRSNMVNELIEKYKELNKQFNG